MEDIVEPSVGGCQINEGDKIEWTIDFAFAERKQESK